MDAAILLADSRNANVSELFRICHTLGFQNGSPTVSEMVETRRPFNLRTNLLRDGPGPMVSRHLCRYQLPLFALSLNFNPAVHSKSLFPLALISSTIHYYIINTLVSRRAALVLSATMYALAVFFPAFFFFAYGFVLSQAHNTATLISAPGRLSRFIMRMHLLGFCIAQHVVLPIYLQMVGAITVLVLATQASPPPCESADPVAAMRAMIVGNDLQDDSIRYTVTASNGCTVLGESIVALEHADKCARAVDHARRAPERRCYAGSFVLLADEYRALYSQARVRDALELGIFYAMFLLTDSPRLLAFCAFLNPINCALVSAFICAAAALGWTISGVPLMDVLALFADFGESQHVPFKLLTGYLLYVAINYMRLD
ncbi:hypothetical protein PAPHI01_2541 [Pancytospora philotis]|nr:hypothetical protein PAPHI01_2541 [Pancytospora philotis]